MAGAVSRDADFTYAENEALQREDEIHLIKCVKSTIAKGLAELMKSLQTTETRKEDYDPQSRRKIQMGCMEKSAG